MDLAAQIAAFDLPPALAGRLAPWLAEAREEAARADATRRIAALVEQQVGQLPEEQRQATRERVWKLLDAKTVAGGDVEKVLQVAEIGRAHV